jgi:cobalt/nickel transport system permease protein
MLARGFVGRFHAQRHPRFGAPELRFVLAWSALFIVLRIYDIPGALGALITGAAP